jgi:hypothetical protein
LTSSKTGTMDEASSNVGDAKPAGIPEDLRRFVEDAISAIEPRLGDVFRSRRPLDGTDPDEVPVIAARYGLTTARIYQLDALAASALRERDAVGIFQTIVIERRASILRCVEAAGGPRKSSSAIDKLLLVQDVLALVALEVAYAGDYLVWYAEQVDAGVGKKDQPKPRKPRRSSVVSEATALVEAPEKIEAASDPDKSGEEGLGGHPEAVHVEPVLEPVDEATSSSTPDAPSFDLTALTAGAASPLPVSVLAGCKGLGIGKRIIASWTKDDHSVSGYLIPESAGHYAELAGQLHTAAERAPFPFTPYQLAVLHEERFGEAMSAKQTAWIVRSNPHLFVRLHDGAWFTSSVPGRISLENKVPKISTRMVDIEEEPVLLHVIEQLAAEGPATVQGTLARARIAFPKLDPKIEEEKIKSSPLIEKYGPQLFGAARDCGESSSFGKMQSETCRNYALARFSGVPFGWYRQWTPEYEEHLCRWADKNDDPSLSALLNVCRPSSWPSADHERRAWITRKKAAAAWKPDVGRKAPPSQFLPTPQHVVAGLMQVLAYGSIGWVQARRIIGRGSMPATGTGLLAFLTAIGAVEAPVEWYAPHTATSGARSILEELLGELRWGGRLTWDVGIPSDMIRTATKNGDDAVWIQTAGWVGHAELQDLLDMMSGPAEMAAAQ